MLHYVKQWLIVVLVGLVGVTLARNCTDDGLFFIRNDKLSYTNANYSCNAQVAMLADTAEPKLEGFLLNLHDSSSCKAYFKVDTYWTKTDGVNNSLPFKMTKEFFPACEPEYKKYPYICQRIPMTDRQKAIAAVDKCKTDFQQCITTTPRSSCTCSPILTQLCKDTMDHSAVICMIDNVKVKFSQHRLNFKDASCYANDADTSGWLCGKPFTTTTTTPITSTTTPSTTTPSTSTPSTTTPSTTTPSTTITSTTTPSTTTPSTTITSTTTPSTTTPSTTITSTTTPSTTITSTTTPSTTITSSTTPSTTTPSTTITSTTTPSTTITSTTTPSTTITSTTTPSTTTPSTTITSTTTPSTTTPSTTITSTTTPSTTITSTTTPSTTITSTTTPLTTTPSTTTPSTTTPSTTTALTTTPSTTTQSTTTPSTTTASTTTPSTTTQSTTIPSTTTASTTKTPTTTTTDKTTPFSDQTWIRSGLVDLYINYNKTSFLEALYYCRSQLNATLVAYPRPSSYLTLHGTLNLSRASFWVGDQFNASACLTLNVTNPDARRIQMTLCETRLFSVCARSISDKEALEDPEYIKIIERLSINKRRTNKALRKLQSAKDRRSSAKVIGTISAAVLCCMGLLLVLCDAPRCKHSLDKYKNKNQTPVIEFVEMGKQQVNRKKSKKKRSQ